MRGLPVKWPDGAEGSWVCAPTKPSTPSLSPEKGTPGACAAASHLRGATLFSVCHNFTVAWVLLCHTFTVAWVLLCPSLMVPRHTGQSFTQAIKPHKVCVHGLPGCALRALANLAVTPFASSLTQCWGVWQVLQAVEVRGIKYLAMISSRWGCAC